MVDAGCANLAGPRVRGGASGLNGVNPTGDDGFSRTV